MRAITGTIGIIQSGRLTCRDNVVDDQDLLAGLDGVLLHLEVILTVLLLVGGRHARARELALLADRHEAGTETEGKRGTEEEATGIEADHDVGLAGRGEVKNLELEGTEELLVNRGVLEEGQNVDKVDALDREVLEATELLEQGYLCTGEFGGTGGGGGGLSSRGILAGVGLC